MMQNTEPMIIKSLFLIKMCTTIFDINERETPVQTNKLKMSRARVILGGRSFMRL